jgi:CRISPR-associated protein Cas2
MFLLVCYDVETTTKAGRTRLRRVAKTCESYGQRAQKSVFECRMEPAMYLQFEAKLTRIIDKNLDSLRIYFLDEDSVKKIKHVGLTTLVDFDEPLIL